MIRDRILEAIEPEIGNGCEHLALAGYGRRHDDVEGGDPVAGDDEDMRGIDRVEIADFAAMEERKPQLRLEQAHSIVRRLDWNASLHHSAANPMAASHSLSRDKEWAENAPFCGAQRVPSRSSPSSGTV